MVQSALAASDMARVNQHYAARTDSSSLYWPASTAAIPPKLPPVFPRLARLW